MKPKHIFAFILITLISHRLAAQKHELQIGVPGTFYFNEIAPRLTSLKAIPIPTHFAYSFTLKNDYKIRARYDYYWINYNYPYLEIPNNTIIARRFSEYSIGVGKKWMDLTERIELGYNSNLLYRRGTELYHRYYYIHWGITSRLEGLPYNDLGLDLGGQINYKFTKYFGVGFTASYARYFSKLSPNTLRFAMFTSIRF
jgi:hypothetical protein